MWIGFSLDSLIKEGERMKNLALEKIKQDLDAVNSTHGLVIQKLQKELKEVVELALVPHLKTINDAVERLQDSQDLTYIDDEYAYQFIHVDFSDILEDIGGEQVDIFKDWLNEHHGVLFDSDHSCLLSCIGPAIVVNDNGSVYDQDSNKIIIRKAEYDNEDGLKALIEAYMEKSGYFPWTLRQDYYGNVFVYNTKGE